MTSNKFNIKMSNHDKLAEGMQRAIGHDKSNG